jgi:uncharacterized OsmC-like protein
MNNSINGVNVVRLAQTIEAVSADPTIAKFRFRLKNEWMDGSHTRSTLNDFYGTKQTHTRPQSFVLHADEPPVLLGNDQAPNPGEYLLTALAACVTSAIVYHAAARGIEIEDIESTVEGDVDLRGFLGIDPNVRKGFENIRITLAIQANSTDQELQELANLGLSFSPVFDSVTKGVPVTVQTQRMKPQPVSDAA